MRLGLTLPIMAMETLPSFLSYAAQKNGSRHVQDFVNDMDLSWRGILQLEPETVQELADLTGASVETLSANSFAAVTGGLFRLRAHDLPKTFLDRSGLKYCPICVENDRATQGRTWGRAIWQINPIRVCAQHGVVLERFDQAQYPRSPHDFAVRIADHRKRVADETPTDAGRSACQFARYLSRRLFNKACPECSSWLNELPVDVAARLCENIGVLIVHGAERHSQSLEPKRLIAAGAAGFEICEQGPDAVSDVYETIRRTSPNAKGGFSVDFGFYVQWLHRLSDPERYEPVLNHFRAFVLENYPLPPGQQILGQVVSERSWYSWSELRQKYGLTFGRTKA